MLLVSCAFSGAVFAAQPELTPAPTNKEMTLALLTTAGKTVVPGVAGCVLGNFVRGTGMELPLLAVTVLPFVFQNKPVQGADKSVKSERLATVVTATRWFALGMWAQKAVNSLPIGYTRGLPGFRS